MIVYLQNPFNYSKHLCRFSLRKVRDFLYLTSFSIHKINILFIDQALYPVCAKSTAELGLLVRRPKAGFITRYLMYAITIRILDLKFQSRYGDKYDFSISCESIVTNDIPDKSSVNQFQGNLGAEFDAMSFKPSLSLLQYETDILGFINFCLRTEDSALSGPSRYHILLSDHRFSINE